MVSTRLMTTSTPTTDIGNNCNISNGNSTQMPLPAMTAIPAQQNQVIRPQSVFLFDLPIEILDNIFSYVGFKKTAQLRVVSRQMNIIGASILNSTFQRLQTQLLNRFQNVKAKMPRRESARRNHPLACECDIIETCYMRLSLLQMTFGKHIERKHCCFFPGGILDEVYNVLNYIRNTPKLARPFKATDELFDLSTMAMEYFKDYIEPILPEIAHFSSPKPSYLLETKTSLSVRESNSNSVPSPPQSNMVLRKGIRKIKQGMKKYNNQLSVLRNELRTCKRKANEQAKQISDQQKLVADQQKQTLEYANRLDENDKKNEEMSRKFSTLLQELNKCKTELQYWRSKSPATPVCTSCGQTIAVPPEEMQALVNQGVKPEDISLELEPIMNETDDDANSLEVMNSTKVVKHKTVNDLSDEVQKNNDSVETTEILNTDEQQSLVVMTMTPTNPQSQLILQPAVVVMGKRKLQMSERNVAGGCGAAGGGDDQNMQLMNDNKKMRRVQNKNSNRCQNNVSNTSTVSSNKGRK